MDNRQGDFLVGNELWARWDPDDSEAGAPASAFWVEMCRFDHRLSQITAYADLAELVLCMVPNSVEVVGVCNFTCLLPCLGG